MRIKEEEFKKLKQLDRIEFRQRYKFLNERYEGGTTLYLAIRFAFIVVLVCMFSLLLVAINQDYTSVASELVKAMYKIVWIPLIGIPLDIFNIIAKVKALNKLQEDYFEVKTK